MTKSAMSLPVSVGSNPAALRNDSTRRSGGGV